MFDEAGFSRYVGADHSCDIGGGKQPDEEGLTGAGHGDGAEPGSRANDADDDGSGSGCGPRSKFDPNGAKSYIDGVKYRIPTMSPADILNEIIIRDAD